MVWRDAEGATPMLRDEVRWYTEHTALLVSTLKWALLGAGAGACVGYSTRGFLWTISYSGTLVRALTHGAFSPFWLLPLTLPLCVWLIRVVAPDAQGHGTDAVIAAVHTKSGRIDWAVAPVKLVATLLTLAFGGSVGKEGPAAQIGAALTSLGADILRLTDQDRRRLVICGISAGFAAVFGTPISGAIFGIEVLYLGRIDYTLIFPAMVAGIIAHLTCGVQPPFPALSESMVAIGQTKMILLSIGSGAFFGIAALLLIESLRAVQRAAHRIEARPYVLAAIGGAALVVIFFAAGDRYAGLGVDTIDGVLAGTMRVAGYAFLIKIAATAITLETGGSGGIVTPIFFVGATAGAALGQLLGVSPALLAAFGFVSVLAAAANTPIAAAIMAIEVLPRTDAVYAALAAVTAFLIVGHRSVYASQKLGISKSAGLEFELGSTVGDFNQSSVRVRKGSLTERINRFAREITGSDGGGA